MTQKERWNDRAERYEAAAAALSLKANRLLQRDEASRDIAFLTQPGHIPARARMIARDDRAFAMLKRAEECRAKAANLRTMAVRNKGDAERSREMARASIILQVGALTDSIWGRRAVIKVNAKSVRLEGVSCPVDKAHLRVLAE